MPNYVRKMIFGEIQIKKIDYFSYSQSHAYFQILFIKYADIIFQRSSNYTGKYDVLVKKSKTKCHLTKSHSITTACINALSICLIIIIIILHEIYVFEMENYSLCFR